jgi:hypothetical protein
VAYWCSNKVYGTDNLPGLTTSAFAPTSVVPSRWSRDDDEDEDWNGGYAEIHTYSMTDAFVPATGPAPVQNPNQVTLVERVRQMANAARVEVMSYRYRKGAVLQPEIVPDRAVKKYDWTTNADGSLKSLDQKFELHKGHDRQVVQASFDVKSGVTTIKRVGHDASHVTTPGLILLRMTTSRSIHKPPKQHATRGRVPEERHDQVAMAVELRGPADDRHHAIRQREVEQQIDFGVRHPLREHAERQLRLEFRSEPLTPPLLIDGQCAGIEPVVAESRDQRVGGEIGADEAVVDASAGRRLHEAGGVSDHQQPGRIGAWQGG